jgi:hypothetical protein
MRSCISVCHVSAGDSWAGIENPVATLLRALSTYPQLDLSAIVLQDGHLARELRGFGIAVRVVNEEQKSFPRVISDCSPRGSRGNCRGGPNFGRDVAR